MAALKSMRLKVGLTQDQLAKAVGTSKGNISKWETGERDFRFARTDTVKKIADALRCTVDELLKEDEFEYDERGRLIVDGLYHDDRYPLQVVVCINGVNYVGRVKRYGQAAFLRSDLSPIRVRSDSAVPYGLTEYSWVNCIPRDFKVEVKKPVLNDVLEELVEKYNLVFEAEFVDSISHFGVVKTFTVKQYTGNYTDIITVEKLLIQMDVQCSIVNAGIINIRVK